MKFYPTNRNALALTLVAVVVLLFFTAGLFKVLDYPIVKAVLFLSFGSLFITAVFYMIKNDTKKNRPED